MTDTTRPYLDHAAQCKRRRPPILRLAWGGTPEAWCPDCGRTAPAPDTRTTTEAATATPDDKKE